MYFYFNKENNLLNTGFMTYGMVRFGHKLTLLPILAVLDLIIDKNLFKNYFILTKEFLIWSPFYSI